VRDLETGHERGLYFDEQAAQVVVAFFAVLRHWKGEWARQPVVLAPWQQFVVASLFGWKRADGSRRFRTGYLEVARKNGKTTLAAGIALYLAFVDGEPGAEVYSAAPLALDTEVPTSDGWKTMGTIEEGDRVFDEAGQLCQVTYVSPVFHDRDCYEVVFNSGTRIIADKDHRWATQVYSTGRPLKGRKRESWLGTRQGGRTSAIFTTEEIKNTLRYQGGNNHRLPVAKALDLPDAPLPIAPYTLGVWLGDGRSNRGTVVIHPDDAEIARHVEADGFAISRQGGDLYRFTPLGLRTALRKNDLLDNKHIPGSYFRASRQQRLDLLHGLMDTDGMCTTSGECRFTNRNKQLTTGVYELALTLGIKAHMREVSVTGKPHYIISFKTSRPVFKLERKRQRQITREDRRVQSRYILEVNEVPSVPVRCISVDSPSHLYLVSRDLVPTHNTKRDQAKICHKDGTEMVKLSPELRGEIGVFRDNLHQLGTGSKFEPLSADYNTLDGLNVHGAICDELHAWQQRELWGVLKTGMGSRRQPLQFAITTAGVDQQNICYEQREYVTRILKGVVEDDTFWGCIYTLDTKRDWPDLHTPDEHENEAEGDIEDDWRDEDAWLKANPMLGVSKKWGAMRADAREAANKPAELNMFLRWHLDIWTQAVTRWINPIKWAGCNHMPPGAPGTIRQAGTAALRYLEDYLEGRRCYAGLDLSSNLDITAWVLLFEPEEDDEPYWVLPRFFIPRDNILDRVRKDRVPYDAWERAGLLITTPGNVIDYDFILAQVDRDAQQYDIEEIGFDRWGASRIMTQLMEKGGDEWVVPIGQGFASMNSPMKQFEELYLGLKLGHGGHPVLTWMADNLVAAEDPAGNMKPDKSKSRERIDGIVALIMATDRAMRRQGGSVYDERELLVI
jgi:phage terminase large subunit-like protein